MKYFLTEPVHGGYAFWDVRLPEFTNPERDEIYSNFILASFSIHMPNAEKEARALLARLNG